MPSLLFAGCLCRCHTVDKLWHCDSWRSHRARYGHSPVASTSTTLLASFPMSYLYHKSIQLPGQDATHPTLSLKMCRCYFAIPFRGI